MVDDNLKTSDLSDEDPPWLVRVERYLDGAATDEEMTLLRQELSTSSRKREAFMRMADIVASLTEWSASDRGVVLSTPSTALDALPAPRAWFGRTFKIPMTAYRWAALVALSLGLLAVLTFSMRQSPKALAVFVAGTDVEWGGSISPRAGTPLPEGVVHLAHGYASVQMAKAALLVEGPADFRIESPTRVKLLMGKITANVSDASSHFTIVTASAQVTDLGTEFGVCAGADGDTEVLVFRGSVAMTPVDGTDQSKVTLHAAEGARVEMKGSVVMDGSESLHFVRSLNEVRPALATTMPAAMVAWWRFEDPAPPSPSGKEYQSNAVADSSGHGNALNWWHGRDDGATAARWSSTEVPPASMFRPGLNGGARSFLSGGNDSRGSSFTRFNSAAKRRSPFFFDGSFTVEVYFKTAGDQSHAGMLTILRPQHVPAQDLPPQYRLGLNGDVQDAYGTGAIGLTVLDKNMKDVSVSLSDANYADGKWHYVAAFYDAVNASIRLLAIDEDGGSHENSAPVPNGLAVDTSRSGNLLIGSRFPNPGEGDDERFQGLLDEIRISNDIVPDAQLMAPVVHP